MISLRVQSRPAGSGEETHHDVLKKLEEIFGFVSLDTAPLAAFEPITVFRTLLHCSSTNHVGVVRYAHGLSYERGHRRSDRLI